MTKHTWRGSGSTYSLWWGGRRWNLSLTQDRPAVRRANDPAACYLSLVGLAATGRSDFQAFSSGSLVGVEQYHSSVQATYSPQGWAGLQIRATWTPVADRDGLDLDVQVLTSSVGELKAVEVYVATRLLDPGQAIGAFRLASSVTPRDARSASLSYDGREEPGELRLLTTHPVPGPDDTAFAPVSLARTWPDRGVRYVEMVHPHDVSRRIAQKPCRDLHINGAELAVRYGLFGHDLEKGVIVRGRLRGLWVDTKAPGEAIAAAYQEFLDLPPPLGT